MKRCIALSLVLLTFGCSSIHDNRVDPSSAQPIDSVKMGFWDAPTLFLWGVPYDRFRFELQAVGSRPLTKWVAIIDCKNINAGPAFTMSVDGRPRTFSGRLYGEKMMAYDLTEEEVGTIANGHVVVLRIEHRDRSDSAQLQDGQIAAIRDLYQRHANNFH